MQSSLTEVMLGYHCQVAEAMGMREFSMLMEKPPNVIITVLS